MINNVVALLPAGVTSVFGTKCFVGGVLISRDNKYWAEICY